MVSVNEKLEVLSEKYDNLISGCEKGEKVDLIASDSPDGTNNSGTNPSKSTTKKPCEYTIQENKNWPF